MLLSLGLLRAALPTPPAGLEGASFRITGTVKVVDKAGRGLVLAPTRVTALGKASPEALRDFLPGDIALVAREEWGQMNPLVAAFLAAAEPGKEIAVEAQVTRDGQLTLRAFSGDDAAVERRRLERERLKGLGVGAHIDESKVVTVVRVDPSHAAAGDDQPGTREAPVRTIRAGLRLALEKLRAGVPTKLSLAAGIYREDAGVVIFEGAARETLFVIEGAPDGRTIWSGSDEWPGATWEDIGAGVFARSWPHAFGHYTPEWGVKNYLGQRAEMMFLDGHPLRQRLIEVYDYTAKGNAVEFERVKQAYRLREVLDPRAALTPGTFGVAERDDSGKWANRIFARPENPDAFRRGRVEVAVRRQLVAFGDKENLVLRNLVFQHAASMQPPREPSQPVVFFDRASYQNVLIENCRFEWNAGHGLSLANSAAEPRSLHFTLRDCAADYNGFSGISGGTARTLWERNRTNFNNWRGFMGDQTSWWIGGVKLHNTEDHVVRGHESIGNLAPGFWYDVQCERIHMEDTVTALNTRGVFFELSNGLFTLVRALSVRNSNKSLNVSVVADYTVRDSIFYDDSGGAQGHKGEPTPVISSQWYERKDEHARQRPLRTGLVRYEGNVIAGGSRQAALIGELVPGQLGGVFADYRYEGRNNLYFLPGREEQRVFFYSPKDWSREAVTPAEWLARSNETGGRWLDPGFRDPEALDFRPREDSPLLREEERLPLRQISPARLSEAKAFFRWIGYVGQELETLDR
jgi:hypothetical protein